MAADNIKEKVEVISLFIKLPLWFIIQHDELCIWNRDTTTLSMYRYNEIEVIGKSTESSGVMNSSEQRIDEIHLVLPDGQIYTINPNDDQNFDHFYASLLGQLAIHY